MEPRQWIRDGLLWALVCYRCSRRYANDAPDGSDSAITARLLEIAARPPGQVCPQTRGKGHQKPARPFNSRVGALEIPTPEWGYYNTAAHSLLLWQRGRCGICLTGLPVTSAPRSVHLDHDHVTGWIRGLLCHRCNVMLGKEELGILPRGAWEHHEPFVRNYLEHPPAKYLPATRGRPYGGGRSAAWITMSADGTEMLLDGVPRSLLEPKGLDLY